LTCRSSRAISAMNPSVQATAQGRHEVVIRPSGERPKKKRK
jgi:hypothetical protein